MSPEPITVRSLSDVALIAPYMLGYWPQHSVCVIVVDDDGHVLLIMRWHVDAPEVPPHLPLADDAGAAAFHLVIYAEDGHQHTDAWTGIADDIASRGIPRGRVLAVGHLSDETSPEAGFAVHTFGASGEAAEEARVSPAQIADAGKRWAMPPWAISREEYVADITADGALVEQVHALLVDTGPLDEAMRDRAIALVGRSLDDGRMTPDVIASLLVSLADVRVRDTVLWDLMHSGPDIWRRAADRLARVVAGSPDGHVAPAATLLAILRWQLGDGSRAAAAVERALTGDPGYALADLINRSLLVGLHPGVWAEGLVGLSREACRRSA
jgi:hypothetical protein